MQRKILRIDIFIGKNQLMEINNLEHAFTIKRELEKIGYNVSLFNTYTHQLLKERLDICNPNEFYYEIN